MKLVSQIIFPLPPLTVDTANTRVDKTVRGRGRPTKYT
jgi:hypothetical protein